MIRVVIADDHQMFRQGLATLLKKTTDLQVVGEASDGREAIKEVLRLKPDILLLDIAMPSLNGVEVTKRLTKRHADTRILILTMHADMFFSMEALKAGAMGYLLKEDSFRELVGAIRAVNRGRYFVSPALETPVIKGFVNAARHTQNLRDEILTEREREILQLITEGLTNQTIAENLCISVTTVDTHRKNIMAKLDIHSVAGLVKYAIKHKIVTV